MTLWLGVLSVVLFLTTVSSLINRSRARSALLDAAAAWKLCGEMEGRERRRAEWHNLSSDREDRRKNWENLTDAQLGTFGECIAEIAEQCRKHERRADDHDRKLNLVAREIQGLKSDRRVPSTVWRQRGAEANLQL